jgi:hypothetical protein
MRGGLKQGSAAEQKAILLPSDVLDIG